MWRLATPMGTFQRLVKMAKIRPSQRMEGMIRRKKKRNRVAQCAVTSAGKVREKCEEGSGGSGGNVGRSEKCENCGGDCKFSQVLML